MSRQAKEKEKATRPASSRCARRRRRQLASRAFLRVLLPLILAGIGLLATAGTAQAFSVCPATPPPVETPVGGDTAVLDPNVARVNDATRYGQRGYAGLAWSTYDLGCIGDVGAELDTEAGNLLLGIAVVSTAAWQGLAALATDVDLAPAGQAAGDTAAALWGALFSPWAGVAVTLSALVMLFAAGRAETSRVLTRATLNIVALGLAALALNGAGVSLADDLRGVFRDAVASVQTGVSAQLGADPIAGPRNLVIDQVLWVCWRAGEVGPTGSDQLAQQLYEAQSLTKAEAAQISTTPAAGKQIFEQKSKAWQAAATDAQNNNPAAYQAIQGKGASRFGAGARALFMAAPIAWFQILTLIFVLGVMVFCALLPIAAPVVGLAAVLAPGALEKSIKAAGMVLLAGLASAVAAITQIALATRLLGAGPASFTTAMILLAVTIVLRRKLKPLMSISGVLGAAAGAPARAAVSYGRYRALRRMMAGAYTGNQGRDGTWVDATRRTARPAGTLLGTSARANINRPRRRPPGSPPGAAPAGGGPPPTPGPNGGGGVGRPPGAPGPHPPRRPTRGPADPPRRDPGSGSSTLNKQAPAPRVPASASSRPGTARRPAQSGWVNNQAGLWVPANAIYLPTSRSTAAHRAGGDPPRRSAGGPADRSSTSGSLTSASKPRPDAIRRRR